MAGEDKEESIAQACFVDQRLCINKTRWTIPEPEKQTPAKTRSPKGGFQPAITPRRQSDTGTTTIAYTVWNQARISPGLY